MNAYVRERLAGAIVGVNAFQIRRDPIQVGFIDDEAWKQIQRRPIIAPEDVGYIRPPVPKPKPSPLRRAGPRPTRTCSWGTGPPGSWFSSAATAPTLAVQASPSPPGSR